MDSGCAGGYGRMIHQFTLTFAPAGVASPLTDIHMSSLHGWLFQTVLPAYSQDEANWLHEHSAPKPFALAPIFAEAGELTGLRVVTWAERAAAALTAAWPQTNTIFQLGPQSFTLSQIKQAEPVDFVTLLEKARPRSRMRLQFKTPTAFRQGPLRLHLPVPGNVFERPFQVWNTFAPASLHAPASWPAWCAENVMASQHHIQTQVLPLNQKAIFVGFTGFVEFEAKERDEASLRIWQALGRLASYCGVGYKTTMGMGSVAYLTGRRR